MKSIYIGSVCVALSFLFVAIFASPGNSYPQCPPAGWKIETRDGDFRWVMPNDGQSMSGSESSAEDAVNRAWRFFEHNRFGEKWVPVDVCKIVLQAPISPSVSTSGPAPQITPSSESDQAALLETINRRTDELRVREIEGALFEQLALDFVKDHANVEREIAVAKQVAVINAPKYSEYENKVIAKATDNFESKIRSAQAGKHP